MRSRLGDRDLVAIRPMVLDDVPRLVAIEEEAFPGDRLDRRAFRHAVRSPTILALTASDAASGPLGYVLVQIRRGSEIGWLTSVAVARSALGDGLGRVLVSAAERAAKEAGRDRIRLEVRADNAAAIKLYQSIGYRSLGRLEDYYDDGEAALKYEKALTSS